MSTWLQAGKTSVKICGITSLQQGLDVAAAGADALGINFWPKSKRFVDPGVAGHWIKQLRSATIVVAVTVNPDDALVAQIAEAGLVDVLQLHGDETPERCAVLASFGLPIVKAFQIRDESSLDVVGRYDTTFVLLDSYNPGHYGGEGRSFPWHLVQVAKQRFPHKQIILAGGLTPENVADAVDGVQPAAVDVASGVESAPGVKDLTLVRDFIARVHDAQNGLR
jgi:phosphoribosylanthranilate isomerase